MLGIDYSFARPGAANIKAAGYQFVCRYLASSAGKRITAAEVADLHNNGLQIVLVFEDYANQALNGRSQGVADAQEALAQANAIGLPGDRPIYFAVDFDATPAQQAPIDAYLSGAASVLGAGRVGVYGGFYVVQRCSANGSAKWFWQAVAWSGGQQFNGNHLYQNGQSAFNGGADINESKKADFGQWGTEAMADITQSQEQELSLAVTGDYPGENYDYRNSKSNVVTADIDRLTQFWHDQSVVPALKTQVADLTKKLADAQAQQGGFTAADRTTLNWIQKAIATVFRI